MQRSEQIDQLATALVKAQAELPSAKKNSVNPHFRNHYADFKAVTEAASVIHQHGLAYIQTSEVREGQLGIVTTLIHVSGQWISGFMPVVVGDQARQQGPQSWGSGITYAKRYALSAILGIAADEDDDGNSAQNQKVRPEVVQHARGLAADPVVQKVQSQFDAKVVGVVGENGKYWGDVICPLGARKGQKLSEMPAKSIEWWHQNYEVNPKYPDSIEFRKALDDWKAESDLAKASAKKAKEAPAKVEVSGTDTDADGNPLPF